MDRLARKRHEVAGCEIGVALKLTRSLRADLAAQGINPGILEILEEAEQTLAHAVEAVACLLRGHEANMKEAV